MSAAHDDGVKRANKINKDGICTFVVYLTNNFGKTLARCTGLY